VASDGLQPVRVRLLEPTAGVAVHLRREHHGRRYAMSDTKTRQYDVVIVGAGVSGNTIAMQLGLAGKKVLILEAGLSVPDSREQLTGGGTSWHWLGTSLRELENDIRLKTKYGHGEDWPLSYGELQELWALAEKEIGVAASTAQQEPLEVVGLDFPPGYQYPM